MKFEICRTEDCMDGDGKEWVVETTVCCIQIALLKKHYRIGWEGRG